MAGATSASSRVILEIINSQKIVCPTREELQIEDGEYMCPSEGCGKVFQASSQLQMHITRHHHGQRLTSTSTTGSSLSRDCVYYCPVEGCPRSKSNGQPFPRLGQLKQHYHTVHGSKEYCCQKCGKKFGLRDVCNRHQAECGSEFSCETCGEKFRTRNAHYKHAVRKKHVLPAGSKPKPKQKGSGKTGNTILRPPTVVVKNVVQLPKRVSTTAQTRLTGLEAAEQVKSTPQTNNMAVQVDTWQSVLKNLIEGNSSASQTNESYLSVHSPHGNTTLMISSSEKSNTSVGTAPPISTLCSGSTREDDNQLNLELTDFATQTDDYSFTPPHFNLATQTDSLSTATCTMGVQHDGSTNPFSFSDLATQTTEDDFVRVMSDFSFNDLATQTTKEDFDRVMSNFSFNDLATQTSEEDIGGVSSNFGNPLSPSSFIEHSGSAQLLNNSSSSQSQAIQTLPLLTNEFGTQTQTLSSLCHLFQSEEFPQFPPPPMAATNLSSVSQQRHGCCSNNDELHHHYHHHHDQAFSRGEIDSAAATDSVVDFGTQTTTQLPLSYSNNSVSDFGTQTTLSDKELSDLVCELSSESLQHILPPECMDFGTQTLESEFAGIECLDFGVQTTFGLELSTEHQDQSSQTQD